jgi:T5SS/PEP-CTERM-associated repeat protein
MPFEHVGATKTRRLRAEITRRFLFRGRHNRFLRREWSSILGLGIFLLGGFQVVHGQESTDYVWVGGNQDITTNSDSGTSGSTLYTYTLSGAFTDASLWGAEGNINGNTPYTQSHDFDYAYGHVDGTFHTTAPGAGDNVYVLGIPDNYAQWVGNDDNQSSGGDFPMDGTTAGFYQGSGGFNLTGVTGTVANMTVTGPGTLSLAGINVTGATTLSSIGGIPVVTGYGPSDDYTLFKVDSYAPSAMTVAGGSLSTPLLTLTAATDLNPVYNQDTIYQPVVSSDYDNSYLVYPLSQAQTGKPDPIADAGSLTISGATLSGDITQVTPVPSNSQFYLPQQQPVSGVNPGQPGLDPATFNPYSSESFTVSPIKMINGATLNAKTELDLIGVNPSDFPNATGTVTLSLDASTINAGTVIVATGLGGYGSGQAGSPAELDLADGSTLNATSAGNGPSSIVVGDTGDGVMQVTGSSTIKSQQTVLGNATDATGTVTLDNSTWTNASFFTVGESGTGSLTVTNNATLTSQDVFYFGLNQDGTGTVTVSNGGSIKTQTTGIDGTSSTVMGVVAGSSGTLNVEGSGSKFESQGAMSIGYSGTGEATISDGGSLVVDDTVLRVGRNEGSEGTLTITGSGSSLTESNGTIYIGYGGEGTVTVESGASMTVEGTDIGGEATGDGELDIQGSGTTADLGDLTVGDAGTGTMNVTDGAVVNTKDITVGAQETDPTIDIGSNAQVIADGDMVVGDLGEGFVTLTDHASLSVGSITVGSGETGDGTLTIETNSTVRTTDDVTVGDEEGSEGEVDVTGTGSSLNTTASRNGR